MTRERRPDELPKPAVILRALRHLRDAIRRADDQGLLCPAARGTFARALNEAADVFYTEEGE